MSDLKTIDQAVKGDRVSFTFKGYKVTGVVVRVKKDGTKTVEADDKFEDEFDEKVFDFGHRK